MPTKPGALALQQTDSEGSEPGDDTPMHEDQESAQVELNEDAGDGGKQPTPQQRELFDLVVGRALRALAEDGAGLNAALKADPVQATVQFGTRALRAVAKSADDAGKPIPFEILLQAGIQMIKEIGAIANEKGYLPNEQIKTFLKESFQQSIAQYAKLDAEAGELDPSMLHKFSGGALVAPGVT